MIYKELLPESPPGPLHWELEDGITPESARETIISYMNVTKSRAKTCYMLRIPDGTLGEIIRTPKAVSKTVGERTRELRRLLEEEACAVC